MPPLASFTLIGVVLGGHWLWLGFFVTCVVMIFGDALLGEDHSIA